MIANDKGILLRTFNAVLLVSALAALSGCGKNYSRDQFTKLSMHKTEAEVKSTLGDPSWVSDGKPKTWIYYHKTYDAAKKDDYKASLKFEPDAVTKQDKVVDVEFSATSG